MSFDVFLVASSATPDPEIFEARTNGALRAIGAEGSVAEVNVSTADGAWFELFAEGGDGAMFALRGLTPSIAEAIFAVAEATTCFVFDDGTFLRTPANKGAPPEDTDDMPVEGIADAEALLARISGGFSAWSDYRDQIVSAANTSPPKKGWFARLFSKS